MQLGLVKREGKREAWKGEACLSKAQMPHNSISVSDKTKHGAVVPWVIQ